MLALRKSLIPSLLIVMTALVSPVSSCAFAQDEAAATRIVLPTNSEGLFARDRSTAFDDKQTQPGPKAAMTSDQLEADEAAGLPIPKPNRGAGHEKTIFRLSVSAEVRAPLQAVLGFYRRELDKRSDWRKQDEATDATGSARIEYATPEGPALLTLTEKSGTTSVELVVRKQKEAQASGLMPKPGQVRILIPYTDAQLSLAAKTINVKAGNEVDVRLPTLEVKPGTYVASAEVPGLSAKPETISVGADEIWGLIISPLGGVIPLQMY